MNDGAVSTLAGGGSGRGNGHYWLCSVCTQCSVCVRTVWGVRRILMVSVMVSVMIIMLASTATV